MLHPLQLPSQLPGQLPDSPSPHGNAAAEAPPEPLSPGGARHLENMGGSPVKSGKRQLSLHRGAPLL